MAWVAVDDSGDQGGLELVGTQKFFAGGVRGIYGKLGTAMSTGRNSRTDRRLSRKDTLDRMLVLGRIKNA
jgi:hypothetical protein